MGSGALNRISPSRGRVSQKATELGYCFAVFCVVTLLLNRLYLVFVLTIYF